MPIDTEITTESTSAMTAEKFYKQNPKGDIYAYRMATLSVTERNKYNRELLEDSGVIDAMVKAMYDSHRKGESQYKATIAAAKAHLGLGN